MLETWVSNNVDSVSVPTDHNNKYCYFTINMMHSNDLVQFRYIQLIFCLFLILAIGHI